jgi:hypothetical protein
VAAAGVPGHQVSNTKPPGLALVNAQFPYHLHVTNLHPHLPEPPYSAVSYSTPETELQTLGFGFLASTPPPGFALANAQPPWRLHAIHPHLPSPVIAPHRCFTRHARNRATNTRFWVFGLNPTPSFTLVNAQPPWCFHAIHPHPQPPVIVPPHHLMPHGRN